MINSRKIPVKKISVVVGPLLLMFLVMHLFLPDLRRSYTESKLGLQSYESENLEVYANDEEVARDIMDEFQRFRYAFTEAFKGKLRLSPVPRTRIHIFPNSEAFEKYYEDKWRESLPNNSGYYDPSDGAIALVNEGDPGRMQRSIRHEAVHLLLNVGATSNKPGWSAWLNEGLATVFENISYDKGVIKLGNLSREALFSSRSKILSESKGPRTPGEDSGSVSEEQKKENKDGTGWIPIEDLIEVKESAFRSHRNHRYYYQSELLVYYLLSKHTRAFWKFFQYEKEYGPAGKKIFERKFGVSLKTLNKRVKDWIVGIPSKKYLIEIPLH